MNCLEISTHFCRQHCKWENEVSKARPLLKGRETERAAKNMSGQKMKACNGSSLAVVP